MSDFWNRIWYKGDRQPRYEQKAETRRFGSNARIRELEAALADVQTRWKIVADALAGTERDLENQRTKRRAAESRVEELHVTAEHYKTRALAAEQERAEARRPPTPEQLHQLGIRPDGPECAKQEAPAGVETLRRVQEAEARRLSPHQRFKASPTMLNYEEWLEVELAKTEQKRDNLKGHLLSAHRSWAADKARAREAEQELADNKQAVEDLRAVASRLRDERDKAEQTASQMKAELANYKRNLAGCTEALAAANRDYGARLDEAEQERDENATEAYENGYALGLAQGWEKSHEQERNDLQRECGELGKRLARAEEKLAEANRMRCANYDRAMNAEAAWRELQEAHKVACWGLASRTFQGKNVSLGEEAEAWEARTLDTARERVQALQATQEESISQRVGEAEKRSKC